MSSVALFQQLVTEFASLDTDEIEDYLELAADSHTASRFGSRYAEAMVWYAAHMKKLDADAVIDAAAGSSAAGPVTSRKTGDNAETYANLAGSASTEARQFFFQTTYGRKYYRIVRTRYQGRATYFKPG